MAVTNASVVDITADAALATSKPGIISNFDDLLENDVDIEARLTTAEGSITTLEANVTSTNHIAFDVTPTAVPTAIGTTSWNSTTEGIQTVLNADVTHNHGEEMYLPLCLNDSGVEIPNGRLVYLTGVDAGNPKITLVDGTSPTIANSVIAMATQTIAIGAYGRCTREGVVRGLDTSTFAVDTELWLDVTSTLGEITSTEPIGLEVKYKVGRVLVSDLTAGEILFSLTHIFAVQELSNVVITSLANGDVLSHQASSGNWVNIQPPALTYGEIYAYNNVTALALTTINTWYQVVAFGTVGEESNVVGSVATDDLTVPYDGIYKVNFNVSYSGSASETTELQVKKNNGATSFNNVFTSRALGVGGDVGAASAFGLVALSAGDTVELWARCTSSSAKTITIKYGSLSIELKKYT